MNEIVRNFEKRFDCIITDKNENLSEYTDIDDGLTVNNTLTIKSDGQKIVVLRGGTSVPWPKELKIYIPKSACFIGRYFNSLQKQQPRDII